MLVAMLCIPLGTFKVEGIIGVYRDYIIYGLCRDYIVFI